MKKLPFLIITLLSIIFLLILLFIYKYLNDKFEILFYPMATLDILLIVFSYYINISSSRGKGVTLSHYDISDYSIDEAKQSEPIIKRIEKTKIDSFEPVANEILYSLQTMEASVNILSNSSEPEHKISAANLTINSIHHIKDILGQNYYNLDSETEESNISYEIQNIRIKENVTQDFSIGIYSPYDQDSLKLKLILQSSGFFVRMTDNSQEILSSIEDKLIQLLIISPTSENDDSFKLCEIIRQKFSFLDFPILIIVNKYRSYLVERCYDIKINDFLIRPFDLSVLFGKIQILTYYLALNKQKEMLIKSEKEKGASLYFITHNVNTPLTILLNEMHRLSDFTSQGLQKQLQINSELALVPQNQAQNRISQIQLDDIIANIQESANQIDIIIQNVLNSYKISDGRFLTNPKIINLKEYLTMENKFLISKANYKHQSFVFECSKKAPRVFCDENSLKGIYANLVDNAIKYTKSGGHITVSIHSDREFVYLDIIDDGQGIPKEKQIVLFNRFANIGSKPTGSEKTTGLGLYVVNEICKLNDLELSYKENTKAEHGSIFTVKFRKIE
ncbi:MAG: sensor histidine kinase [Treponemataceae bacterium]|nr:sensor histidine kinase [Treponemataceae bacterium]